MPDSEICFSTAVELVRRIREKELSAREVMEAHLSQIERLNPELNAIVTLHPDRALEEARAADEVFKVLRAWTFSLAFGKANDDILKQLKETVVWNIEQGRKLSAEQVGEAEIRRTQLYHRVREFMRDHEFLILPVNQP